MTTTLNTELVNELKGKYKEFLFTEEGKKQLRKALELKREWLSRKGDVTISTAGVKRKHLKKSLRAKVTKLEIEPIGLNNMCHLTSKFFCDNDKDITTRIGYNLTSCPCGKFMSYEFHSVNKIGDKLVDFTKDFNDEKSKFFLEIDTHLNYSQFAGMFGIYPITINKGCECLIRWGTEMAEYLQTEEDLEELIRVAERMRLDRFD